MWPFYSAPIPAPDLEAVRKNSRILVIDDQAFPAMKSFTKDRYHFERWPAIKNLTQLTEGHWDLILLDIQGVGVTESPALQGLGILKAIKTANPAQAVIVYSAQPQMLSSNEYLALADAVFDKGRSYVEYKTKVDELLMRQASPGYFIAIMNRELGESAAQVPKAVPKALKAFRTRNTTELGRHLRDGLRDQEKADVLIGVIAIGIRVISSAL